MIPGYKKKMHPEQISIPSPPLVSEQSHGHTWKYFVLSMNCALHPSLKEFDRSKILRVVELTFFVNISY